MIDRRDWKEFQDAGLVWWINRILHLFGWAICLTVEENGDISEVFPARCKFRGFAEKNETEGFEKVTKFLDENSKELLKDLDD